MSVGANIKARREALDMTQAELAERVNVTQSMLCQIERETKNPSLQIGQEIAKALNCSIESLIEGYQLSAGTDRRCHVTSIPPESR